MTQDVPVAWTLLADMVKLSFEQRAIDIPPALRPGYRRVVHCWT